LPLTQPNKAGGRIGRYLERIYNVQEYLDEEEDNYARKQREIRQIGASLREALGKGNKKSKQLSKARFHLERGYQR